jgi:hypothetical protein
LPVSGVFGPTLLLGGLQVLVELSEIPIGQPDEPSGAGVVVRSWPLDHEAVEPLGGAHQGQLTPKLGDPLMELVALLLQAALLAATVSSIQIWTLFKGRQAFPSSAPSPATATTVRTASSREKERQRVPQQRQRRRRAIRGASAGWP